MNDVVVVVQEGPFVVEQPTPTPTNTCLQGPPGPQGPEGPQGPAGPPGGGGAGDSFVTIETDSGTAPIAESSDTLRIVGDGSIQTVGDESTDEIEIQLVQVDGGFF